MKNNIFHNVLRGLMVVVTLVGMDSVGSMKKMGPDPIDAGRPGEQRPEQGQITADFNQIIATPWDSSSYQEKIDNDWEYFHQSQKKAILKHLYDQGLLSKWLLKSPQRLNVAPDAQKSNEQFEDIMTNPWDSDKQGNVFSFWGVWNTAEKYAILQRLCDQGLLSQSEVDRWNMYVIPEPQ